MLAHGLPSSFLRTSVPAVAEYGSFFPPTVISCFVLEVVSTAGGAGNCSEPAAGLAAASGASPGRRPWFCAKDAEIRRSVATRILSKWFLLEIHILSISGRNCWLTRVKLTDQSPSMLLSFLHRVAARENLSSDDARTAMLEIL